MTNGGFAPRIVGVADNHLCILIQNGDDVALQVLLEVVRDVVVQNTKDGILVIVQGNQSILSPRLPQNLRAVQDVVVGSAVCGLAGTDAVGIVRVRVTVVGLELTPLFPSERMTQIGQRIALVIVSDLLAVVADQQIPPGGVIGVLLAVLGLDVAVVVVGDRVDGDVVDNFFGQLTKGVVAIVGGVCLEVAVARGDFRYLRDAFLVVVGVEQGRVVREGDLADQMGGGRRFDLFIHRMQGGNVAGVVVELSRHEAGAQLDLIKDLSAEGIRLGMGGDGSAVDVKLGNGVVLTCVVEDGLFCAALRHQDFLQQLAFVIVVIANGVDERLLQDDLAVDAGNLALGGADKTAFLVRIIVLSSLGHVNRANDITLQTKNSAPENRCGEKPGFF